MTQNSYPVFRIGLILKAEDDRTLSLNDSVSVGRTLYERAHELNATFSSQIKFLLQAQPASPAPIPSDAEPRIRFSPTTTVGFPTNRFRYLDTEFETRTTVAVCPEQTRGKVWIRLNAISGKLKHDLDRQHHIFRDVAPTLADVWLQNYNNVCEETASKARFKAGFTIRICMISISGKGTDIESLLNHQTSKPMRERPTDEQALEAIRKEFELLAHLPIPSLNEKDSYSRVLSYHFARSEIVERDAQQRVIVEQMADTGFQALCVVSAGKTVADVYGVGLDPVRPDSYRRSASHVASAEISYDLGSMF